MSTPPPEDSAPVPPGYQPGDYVPFKDRDPSNPSSIAGQWADPARAAQEGGLKLTAEEQYRAIYGYDAPTRVVFARWGRRVLGYLVDAFFSTLVAIPFVLGYISLGQELDLHTDPVTGETVTAPDSSISGTTITLLVVGGILVLAFGLWNHVVRQGRTGYTIGKTVVGIRLVKASTGEPMGVGLCFVRQLAHYVDSLACYLGWLWPLWDPQRQTLADKIMGTVVVVQRQDELGS
jgi:uncharacterized RDD family membrane protein YckC